MSETALAPEERAILPQFFVEAFPVLKNFSGQIPEIVMQDLCTRFGARIKNSQDFSQDVHFSGIPRSQLNTPMMKQFTQAREHHPDALLFFRMGDFFELFGLDAVIASYLCRITLTSRDKGAVDPVPMAGVPVVNVKAALKRCVEAGFKVALCDQVEDPKDAKALVRREIVRVLTPAVSGDLFDEGESHPSGQFLASLWFESGPGSIYWTLAAVDSATGDLRLFDGLTQHALEEELLSLDPREVLASADITTSLRRRLQQVFSSLGRQVPVLRHFPSDSQKNEQKLNLELAQLFENDSCSLHSVHSVRGGREVLLSLARYVRNLQGGKELHWKSLRLVKRDRTLNLDSATREHLQLFGGRSSSTAPSLFQFLGSCVTAAGQRLLYSRLQAPSAIVEEVKDGLSKTQFFIESEHGFREEIRAALSQCSDLDRILSRLVMGSSSPRETQALRRTLRSAANIARKFKERLTRQDFEQNLMRVARSFVQSDFLSFDFSEAKLHPLLEILEQAMVESPDLQLGRGIFFRTGFHEELDKLTRLSTGIDSDMQSLLESEREMSGLSGLKLGYNRVFGYYFELTRSKSDRVPDRFVRKQTLANAERYITEELKKLESAFATAEDDRIRLERELFQALTSQILAYQNVLSELNDALADLDLHLNLARLAVTYAWVRPEVTEESKSELKGVVHPIIDAQMKANGSGFVPNDVGLASADYVGEDLAAILLITGPNMAGKSTIMRQVALAHIMAQMGSYVPCKSARIGLCDRIFTRIGAGDDLFGARSTFMVEMSETAHILKQATRRSLLLMDEIGRGTSTWDGMALAWSILEELDNKGARTLFSTHYHELCAACDNLSVTKPMQVEVLENPSATDENEKIIFSHRFIPGAAAESYGIHVARMAGLPESVLERANARLQRLACRSRQFEDERSNGLAEVQQTRGREDESLSTYGAAIDDSIDPSIGTPARTVIDDLQSLSLEQTSPIQLMVRVSRWQEQLRSIREAHTKVSKPMDSIRNARRVERGRRNDHTMDPLF